MSSIRVEHYGIGEYRTIQPNGDEHLHRQHTGPVLLAKALKMELDIRNLRYLAQDSMEALAQAHGVACIVSEYITQLKKQAST